MHEKGDKGRGTARKVSCVYFVKKFLERKRKEKERKKKRKEKPKEIKKRKRQKEREGEASSKGERKRSGAAKEKEESHREPPRVAGSRCRHCRVGFRMVSSPEPVFRVVS